MASKGNKSQTDEYDYKKAEEEKLLTRDHKFRNVNAPDLISQVSGHIKANISDAYDRYDTLTEEEKGERLLKVHHALGKAASDAGIPVLELNLAGSGYTQWNKMYKGFTGYSKHLVPTENPNDQLQADPGISEQNEEEKIYSSYLKDLSKKYVLDYDNPDINDLENALDKEYGHCMYINDTKKTLSTYDQKDPDGRFLAGVRMKQRDNITQVYMAGPLGYLLERYKIGYGASNSGDYSINNLKSYSMGIARKWLRSLSSDIKSGKLKVDEKHTRIPIFIKGHSRGAVAANEASAMINYMLHKEFPELAGMISINTQIYDPVPGTGSYSKHALLDQSQSDFIHDKHYMRGLMNKEDAANNDVSVFYSLHSNHDLFFEPQVILGAKRLILTGMNHTMGLQDIDNGHKRGYINTENGESYRGTGLHELPEGLFILDENKNLIKLENKKEAMALINSMIKSRDTGFWSFLQRSRHQAMKAVVKDWFNLHPSKEIKIKTDRIDNYWKVYKASVKNIPYPGIARLAKTALAGIKDARNISHKATFDKKDWNKLEDTIAAIFAQRELEEARSILGGASQTEKNLGTFWFPTRVSTILKQIKERPIFVSIMKELKEEIKSPHDISEKFNADMIQVMYENFTDPKKIEFAETEQRELLKRQANEKEIISKIESSLDKLNKTAGFQLEVNLQELSYMEKTGDRFKMDLSSEMCRQNLAQLLLLKSYSSYLKVNKDPDKWDKLLSIDTLSDNFDKIYKNDSFKQFSLTFNTEKQFRSWLKKDPDLTVAYSRINAGKRKQDELNNTISKEKNVPYLLSS